MLYQEAKNFEAHVEPFYKPPPSAPRGDSHPYAHASQFTPRSACASATQCPDLLAALLLLAGVGLELGYCWTYGYSYSQSDGDDGETSGRSTFQLMVFLVLAFTCAASLGYLKFVQAGGGAVLELASFMCVTVTLFCCAVCFALQLTRVALALLLACVSAAYHLWLHRLSLPFAGHALEASSDAVLAPRSFISWLCLGVAVLQAAWALVFTTAAVGLQVHNQPSETDDATTMSSTAGVFAFLGLAIVYVWGAQVSVNAHKALTNKYPVSCFLSPFTSFPFWSISTTSSASEHQRLLPLSAASDHHPIPTPILIHTDPSQRGGGECGWHDQLLVHSTRCQHRQRILQSQHLVSGCSGLRQRDHCPLGDPPVPPERGAFHEP